MEELHVERLGLVKMKAPAWCLNIDTQIKHHAIRLRLPTGSEDQKSIYLGGFLVSHGE